MYGFIDSTFRPKGGPSSGSFLIQFCYDKVHDCVLFLQGLFTFVVIVTGLVVSMDTSWYMIYCVHFYLVLFQEWIPKVSLPCRYRLQSYFKIFFFFFNNFLYTGKMLVQAY